MNLLRKEIPAAADCGHLVGPGILPSLRPSDIATTGTTANTRAIPLYNILWAELTNESEQDSTLVLTYATPASKNSVRVATLKYPIEYQMVDLARSEEHT